MTVLTDVRADRNEHLSPLRSFGEGKSWITCFPIVDTFEGESIDPQSLHKYLYCQSDPVNLCDPTGRYPGMSTLAYLQIVCGQVSDEPVTFIGSKLGGLTGYVFKPTPTKTALTFDDLCALLSEAAYDDPGAKTSPIPAGWTRNTVFQYPSGMQATLYVHTAGGANAGPTNYVLAFRGTSREADARADVRQIIGSSEEYQDAYNLSETIKKSCGSSVTFTGHSLGGGLASVAALRTKLNAITFNAAGISERTDTGLLLGARDRNNNIKSYFIPGERLTKAQNNWQQMGWVRVTRPGQQIPLPVPNGKSDWELHKMKSVLEAMGL
jgi:hypothetical protein